MSIDGREQLLLPMEPRPAQGGCERRKIWVKKYGLRGLRLSAKGRPYAAIDPMLATTSRLLAFRRRWRCQPAAPLPGPPALTASTGFRPRW